MCALAGIEAAALTDHNTVGNCAAFADAALVHSVLSGYEFISSFSVFC